MFEHSVKVPRHFKVAANILKKVSTEGGSIKTLLYDNKLRHFNTNALYALLIKAIQHAAEIDSIFENCSLFVHEPRFDPWIARILTTELLFGKKTLPGKSKPEQTILSYKEQFEKFTTAHEDETTQVPVRRPRYVRINTNLLTTSDAIGAFQEEGYRFIRCTSGSYEDYLKQILALGEWDFTQDYHVKTMFVFSPGTRLHEHELYLDNKIILQDKATAMAVHLLAPPPNSTILDMCAAPGMKTTQLAAYIRNQGLIYAVERNEKRYETLCSFVEKSGSKCVRTLHRDALDLKKGEFDDVEYILLDPSCSGSGMQLSVHKYIDENRLAKLTSLQEKFLKHAMNAFPKAKRIIYSTCSTLPEENERVITNVVKTSRAKWRVQDVKTLLKDQWNNFGSGMYGSMGTRCLYARTDTDYTTGFFLAVLDRDPKDFEKSKNVDEKVTENCEANNGDDVSVDHNVEEKKSKKKGKKNNNTPNCEEAIGDDVYVEGNAEEIKSKKKGKKIDKDPKDDISSEVFAENGSHLELDEQSPKKKKKKEPKQTDFNGSETVSNEVSKKKKRHKTENDNTVSEDVEIETMDEVVPKKKKKKDKHKDRELNSNVEESNPSIEEDNVETPKKKKKHKLMETETIEYQQEPLKKKSKKSKKSTKDADISQELQMIQL